MPTEISDWNDLDAVRNDLDGDYVLVNDLDEDTDGYSGIGDDFEPIGDGGDGFTGQLDGDSFEIRDLVIDKPDETFVGLFGQLGTASSVGGNVFDLTVSGDVTGAGESFDEGTGMLAGTVRGDTQVTNVTVEGQVSQPNGDFAAGGLVGAARDEDTELKIESCISDVDVVANTTENVAGLVGYLFPDDDGMVIRESYAFGSVEGNENVGGLVGYSNITVTECYAFGSVDGDDGVGGFVGENAETVTECYAFGSVDGDDGVGGFVGQNNETVTECYAVGSVTGDTNVGGFIGDSSGDEINSYWDTESTGQDTSDGGTGLTTDEMQGSEAETNMDGFDFTDTWDTVEEGNIYGDTTAVDGYPILQSIDGETQVIAQRAFPADAGLYVWTGQEWKKVAGV